jgi:hypothetical protein
MKRFLPALFVSTAVLASLPVPLVAQSRPSQVQAPAPPVSPAYSDPMVSAETIRERFNEVLQRYPRSVPRVLRLDPRLLADSNYMANYPAIQQFIAQYPDVVRNPEYYLAEYSLNYSFPENRDPRQQALDLMRNWVEMFMVFVIVITISIAVLWLLKSLIDHRRWLRVTKTQTDVHSKLLDRFASSEELLAYMRTPAGARFLESAPIALDAGTSRSAVPAPVTRILWSVQAGIVLLMAGAALLVARTWSEFVEVQTMLAMMGTLGAFIGIGFIVSAGAAWTLSKRFGLMNGTNHGSPSSVSAGRIDSSGL